MIGLDDAIDNIDLVAKNWMHQCGRPSNAIFGKIDKIAFKEVPFN